MKHLILIPLLGQAACADMGANYTPILDGRETRRYRADLAECQQLARDQKQFDQETMGASVLGAGAGAAMGAIDSDDALGGAIGGAVFGAVAGGIAGGVEASERREEIVKNCLAGRGHRVVG